MWRVQIALVLLFSVAGYETQRVAPGVPPQNYQPPPPQYQQQVPVHQQQQHFQQQQQFQQVPVQQQQFQQVPVQQQQQFQQVPVQQQQFQQVPVHQQQPQQFAQQQVPTPHHHEHHGNLQPGQILNAENIAREKEHLGEHLGANIDTSKMTEQELQFHYFKLHDADNNNKLDGCELIKSLIHWHEEDNKDAPQVLHQTDEELQTLVDPIFQDVDLDQDGFIDYIEFKKNTPGQNK